MTDTEEISCPTCSGTGVNACQLCNGKGCYSCHLGYFECPTCNGARMIKVEKK